MDINKYSDIDIFFYYGEQDSNLDDEIYSDIIQNLIQPKRSLFYNRSYDSAGINEYENQPNSINLSLMLPFDIVSSISKRNTIVSNGQNNTRDRRVAVSQSTIQVKNESTGIALNVEFIPLYNMTPTVQNIQLGGIT